MGRDGRWRSSITPGHRHDSTQLAPVLAMAFASHDSVGGDDRGPARIGSSLTRATAIRAVVGCSAQRQIPHTIPERAISGHVARPDLVARWPSTRRSTPVATSSSAASTASSSGADSPRASRARRQLPSDGRHRLHRHLARLLIRPTSAHTSTHSILWHQPSRSRCSLQDGIEQAAYHSPKGAPGMSDDVESAASPQQPALSRCQRGGARTADEPARHPRRSVAGMYLVGSLALGELSSASRATSTCLIVTVGTFSR